jgi:hypothetical protein
MDSSPPADGESTPVEPATTEPSAAPRRANTSLIWAVVACLLLGSSAVVRAVQDRHHQQESSIVESCPFPLERLPRTLGHWTSAVEDPKNDQKLDTQTLRITGGKEHIIRMYSDEATGVRLVVLLLFGPVEPVIPHVPEACYPANGFAEVEKPLYRTIKFSYTDASGKEIEDHPATFASAVYRKARILEGVYHSFRYNGEWTPDVGTRKFPRRNPGVFKLQIQRMVVPGESRDAGKYPEPIEDFLKSLIPSIEHEISVGTTTAAK